MENLQVYHQTCSDLDTLDAWGTPRQPIAPCDKFSGLHRGVAQIRAGATEVAPELLPHLGPEGQAQKGHRKIHGKFHGKIPRKIQKLQQKMMISSGENRNHHGTMVI